jgi:hypothetical protein
VREEPSEVRLFWGVRQSGTSRRWRVHHFPQRSLSVRPRTNRRACGREQVRSALAEHGSLHGLRWPTTLLS